MLSTFYGTVQRSTVPDSVALCQDLGFAALEMDVQQFQSLAPELIPLLETGAIHLSAIILMISDFNLGKVPLSEVVQLTRAGLEIGHRFHTAGVVLADCFGGSDGIPPREARRELLREVLDLSLPGSDPSVPVLLEPMLQSTFSTFGTMREVADFIEDYGSPQVKILYDTFHLAWDGFDPLEQLRDYLPLIGHIHLSDSAPGAKLARPLPGAGDIDFGPIVALLEGQPQLRFWSLEGNVTTEDSLRKSVSYLRGLQRR